MYNLKSEFKVDVGLETKNLDVSVAVATFFTWELSTYDYFSGFTF